MPPRTSVIAAAAGVGLGLLNEARGRRKSQAAHLSSSVVLLAVAAAAYPLARRRIVSANRHEVLTVVAATGIGLASRRLPTRRARLLVAAGWLAHGAFDLAHRHDGESRLPRWYPPFCAAFDVVVAGSLARR